MKTVTLVDFATPYPEAVLLKNIDTETVAEALVEIFSHLGVPEETLSDLVQFWPLSLSRNAPLSEREGPGTFVCACS